MFKRKASRETRHGLFPGFGEVEEIGGGAFAVVYRARELETGRMVALKVLKVDTVHPHLIETFHKEILALGKVSDHPNIVTLYRPFTTSDGRPALVLELCRGSLADQVRASGPLEPSVVVRVGIKIAGALETAHRNGFLHRDMKPQNILLTQFGEPALADFGVAALQASAQATAGVFGFTTLHAAPEMLEGELLSPATDVYGLASTMYQLISGLAPFAAFEQEAPASVILRILRDPVSPLRQPEVPLELSELIEAALAKKPESRPHTAAEFARALQQVELAAGWHSTDFVAWGEPLASSGQVRPRLLASEGEAHPDPSGRESVASTASSNPPSVSGPSPPGLTAPEPGYSFVPATPAGAVRSLGSPGWEMPALPNQKAMEPVTVNAAPPAVLLEPEAVERALGVKTSGPAVVAQANQRSEPPRVVQGSGRLAGWVSAPPPPPPPDRATGLLESGTEAAPQLAPSPSASTGRLDQPRLEVAGQAAGPTVPIGSSPPMVAPPPPPPTAGGPQTFPVAPSAPQVPGARGPEMDPPSTGSTEATGSTEVDYVAGPTRPGSIALPGPPTTAPPLPHPYSPAFAPPSGPGGPEPTWRQAQGEVYEQTMAVTSLFPRASQAGAQARQGAVATEGTARPRFASLPFGLWLAGAALVIVVAALVALLLAGVL